MGSRSDLHTLLKTITSNVYFQPPTNVQMVYPAIVYKRDRGDTKFGDNAPYRHTRRYQVTIIHEDPDNDLYDKVAALPMCLHERFYTADNLNHDVFNVYF